MEDANNLTRHIVMQQTALATTGVDPTWDKALHAYLRTGALQRADLEFGSVAKATEKRDLLRIRLEDEHGREWRNVPEAKALNDEAFADGQAADDRWSRVFCEPYWRAGRELVLTPAPTMSAALFKASVIESDEVWNDRGFPADAMEILQADFARLAREA